MNSIYSFYFGSVLYHEGVLYFLILMEMECYFGSAQRPPERQGETFMLRINYSPTRHPRVRQSAWHCWHCPRPPVWEWGCMDPPGPDWPLLTTGLWGWPGWWLGGDPPALPQRLSPWPPRSPSPTHWRLFKNILSEMRDNHTVESWVTLFVNNSVLNFQLTIF